MRTAIFTACALLLILAFVPVISSQEPGDEEAIKQAALDYIEGWYEGNAERMARALHPDLAKRAVFDNKASGKSMLHKMDKKMLVAATETGQGKNTPKDKQQKDVTILDKYENIACVKIVATDWIDYLQVARFDGQWVIVNVLWEMKPKSN